MSRHSLIAIMMSLVLAGCGTFETMDGPADNTDHVTPAEREAVEANEKDLANSFGEIPMETNDRVVRWIEYFKGRGRRHMERYLSRSSRYVPMMKQILREHELPEDLVYVALIESGFNPKAYSHAAAVGYWQFIRPTGKHFDLKINAYVDQRRDFVASTHAAARYFKALYNLFGNWYLAMAAYNVGENRVKRMVMKYYTRDFWELARRKKLPRETINYVPKFIAAALIAKNPETYGFSDIDYQDPVAFETIEVPYSISLKKLSGRLGVSYDDLRALNPEFKSDYVPMYRSNVTVKVPPGKTNSAVAALQHVKSSAPKYVKGEYFYYRIRRGDNLSTLARRHRTTVRRIAQINGISRRSLLRIGQRIKLPENAALTRHVSRNRSRSRSRTVANYSGPGHKVRRGENLSLIARKYGVSVQQLQQWNNLRRRSVIKPGQILKVTSQPESASSASGNRSSRFHRVRRGENLYSIARKYGVTLKDIQLQNGLGSRSLIKVGQKLRISGGNRVHVVRRGETLSHIADRYHVAVNELVQANDLNNRSMIQAGRRLTIP